jgi:hypothetical protein
LHYYVSNNVWDPLSITQTLYACSYDSWYVYSNVISRGGAVQTYPNSQMTFESRPKLSAFDSLPSSFAESTTPSGIDYAYDFAYDIWINGYGGQGATELMIWNYNNGPLPPGTLEGAFSDDGHTYDVYVFGAAPSGDYIAFVATANFTSVTLDLADFFLYPTSKGWIDHGSSGKLWQVDYGVEIRSTSGHTEKFEFTNFSVAPVYA